MEKHETSNAFLLEKVFDAGANTIWREMDNLRKAAPEKKDSMRRRWVWELVQNASDCTPRGSKINIEIKYVDKESLKFAHDGLPFTYENLVDLITQISSKQSDEEEKTGKFGTGFISTHLLSEKVTISGVLKQKDDLFKKMSFELDRSETTYQGVRENIKNTLGFLEDIKQNNSNLIFMDEKIKTTFSYDALHTQEAIEAVKVGIDNLKNTIPYVLAFNKTIGSVMCNGATYKVIGTYQLFESCKIIKVFNPFGSEINVLTIEENNVSIAVLVKNINEVQYRVLSDENSSPKLFCKFPLIGTEDFSFPVALNCPDFDIEMDRNAIKEGALENKEIIKIGLRLYRKIFDYAIKNEWGDLYNLCQLKHEEHSSFQKTIFEIVWKYIELLPIVDVNLYGQQHARVSLKYEVNNERKYQICIPVCEKKDLNDEFWNLVNSFSKFYIPSKESYLNWYSIFKNKIDITDINNWFMKDKSLANFKMNFNDQIDDIYCWLNKYYSFWIKSKGNDSFVSAGYVLNQDGDFLKLSEVYLDNGINENLKLILVDLGENIKSTLLAREINSIDELMTKKKENKDIAKQIQERINRILSDETINNTQRDANTQSIFNKLTNWFLENSKLAEELFDSLYNKRNLLSTPEENIRRFKIAEKVESNNITYEQLDSIIENHNKIGELLDKIDELSDGDLKAQLKHITAHTAYSGEKFELMMIRSIENVYSYLKEIGYSVAGSLEEWIRDQYSDTVFKAIKDGKKIRIVIRPSDQNKIIFYSDEELEALDDTDYELWTDDDMNNTRIITLGDILKTTGVTSIPLRRIVP